MANDDIGAETRSVKAIIEYCDPIYRYCLRRFCSPEEAEDLAQHIIAEAIHGMSSSVIQNLDAWIWTITRNQYRKRLKRQEPVPATVVLNLDDIENPRAVVKETIEKREATEKAFRSFMGIAEKYR